MVQNGSYAWGVTRAKGMREYQEDRYVVKENFCMGYTLFAVLDGHGGSEVVDFCAGNLAHFTRQALLTQGDMNIQQALARAFDAMNNALDSLPASETAMCGCTCVMMLLHDNHLWIANCGDSRAIAGNNQPSSRVVDLSVDHKPNSESEMRRIRALGGTVIYVEGVARVSGALAVSRSFGDTKYAPFVISAPDVTYYPLQSDSAYVLLATDGLWDVMSSQDVHVFVQGQLSSRTGGSASSLAGQAQSTSAMLLDTAFRIKGASDNATVLICALNRSTYTPATE